METRLKGVSKGVSKVVPGSMIRKPFSSSARICRFHDVTGTPKCGRGNPNAFLANISFHVSGNKNHTTRKPATISAGICGFGDVTG